MQEQNLIGVLTNLMTNTETNLCKRFENLENYFSVQMRNFNKDIETLRSELRAIDKTVALLTAQQKSMTSLEEKIAVYEQDRKRDLGDMSHRLIMLEHNDSRFEGILIFLRWAAGFLGMGGITAIIATFLHWGH